MMADEVIFRLRFTVFGRSFVQHAIGWNDVYLSMKMSCRYRDHVETMMTTESSIPPSNDNVLLTDQAVTVSTIR